MVIVVPHELRPRVSPAVLAVGSTPPGCSLRLDDLRRGQDQLGRYIGEDHTDLRAQIAATKTELQTQIDPLRRDVKSSGGRRPQIGVTEEAAAYVVR